MRKIVLISFTPASWSGGVNRWVQDFMRGFPDSLHFSAADVPGWSPGIAPEWDCARALASFARNRVSRDDVIIVDGFWGLGWEWHPNVASTCHGIWSHLTLEDVEQGKPPDFPIHHAVQVKYRRDHAARGGRLVAVSDFIATEMRRQWNIPSYVINNAIDLDKCVPTDVRIDRPRPLVIHGINDPGNENKGWNHIQHLRSRVGEKAQVLSLDEAYELYGQGNQNITKMGILSDADLVVIPSAYEGNSYFCLEALACDVPVVAYNVGLMYRAWGDRDVMDLGIIMDRQKRSPEHTTENVLRFLRDPHETSPRRWVSQFSIQNFHREWREYLWREFRYAG